LLLALDISTSCTGYCLFDEDRLLDIGYINLSKHKGLFEKASHVKDRILSLSHKHNITSIVVEENLQAFRPGLSSAKTLMTLAQFNGVIRWICHESLSVPVTSLNVNSARKLVGLKIDRKNKEKNTKQQVLEWVADNMPKIEWPTKILKSGPNKGKERTCNEAYDMADAYVIGRAHLIENKANT
jgi:Holliday junction resolvasome RuvABC endonuclease subunit|tara:strand:+ start:17756 stop:18307 length:552 start_codon:yes stop_codon:yes gene_type:complete